PRSARATATATATPGPAPPPVRTQGRYGRVRDRALRRRVAVLAAAGALAIAGGVLTTRVETGFIPEMDEGAYVLDYFTPVGTSLVEADALAGHVDDMLRNDPAVATFTRRLGAELGPPAATEASRGDVMVRLKHTGRRSVFT